MIPATFSEWKHCIEVECRLDLTKDYVASRLAILRQAESEETRRFRKLYGDAHWHKVVSWFEQAQQTAGSRR
ncbi:MAG: hypothetical protein JJT85_00885 [Chromatiales bacterium]|nr:hypothetical protein [Chromatiales bacterium]